MIKKLATLAILMSLASFAFAANQLLPNPGGDNGVQTIAPKPSYSRTYNHVTHTMKCYSTQSAGVPSRIMVSFDARVTNTGTAVAGKLSMNRSTTNYAVKSTDTVAVDPAVTSFCFTPFSSASDVTSNWRGM